MRSVSASATRFSSVFILVAGLIFACGGGAASAQEKVLHSFRGGSDGAAPYSTLIADSAGNLYGTTSLGGGGGCQVAGCGTVFKVAVDGTESVLYAFTDGNDGAFPMAGLVADANGNLYGTAFLGGTHNDGTVFMIAPNGSETTLYSFQDASDGAYPNGSLLLDGGNLYGLAAGGGTRGADCNSTGCGVVFEVTTAGTESVRYAFQGGTDGWAPIGSLIADSNGNLYGVTTVGGVNCPGNNLGCGTVFKIAPDGTETQLHVFQGGSDGAGPYAGLVADPAGNFYGTTGGGGSGTYCGGGCGTVYMLAPTGTETVLYSFQGGSDGWAPESSLIMDSGGNLYGTTYFGGGTVCKEGSCGTVFRLKPDRVEQVLYGFATGGGKNPAAGLLAGPHKYLYGTTTAGGADKHGVVLKVKK